MRFPHYFSRFIGASAPANMVLGQAADLDPNTAGFGGGPMQPSDAVDNVLITKITSPSGWPLQRIAIGYSYVGAGPAPALPNCALWIWDGLTGRWYRMPSTFTLTIDQITVADVVGLMDGGPRGQADMLKPSVGGLEVWVSVPAPGGAPDGEYRFPVGPDMSANP